MHTPQSAPIRMAVIVTEYIELDKVLKRENLAASGGEAGYLISQGMVRVNGHVETRKRRKLYPGDLVACNDIDIRITDREPCSVPNGETEQGN
jgi:ribosome-associated protein